MKIITTTAFVIGMLISAQAQVNFGTPPASKISTELNNKKVTHSIDIWELDSKKGNNKMEIVIEAAKYSALNSTDILKGVKITIIPDNSISENEIAKSSKRFEAYIDEDEYSDILVVLNQMINNYKNKEKNKTKGNMVYTTAGGIRIGFNYTENKKVGYLSIMYSESEISCEFSDIKDFLSELRNNIDMASKDLYLPENTNKLKKVKKSDQKAKDVIIDDI